MKPGPSAVKTRLDIKEVFLIGLHGKAREAVFGGVTAALIHHAECPVLMMH